jgi:hypothetical protein
MGPVAGWWWMCIPASTGFALRARPGDGRAPVWHSAPLPPRLIAVRVNVFCTHHICHIFLHHTHPRRIYIDANGFAFYALEYDHAVIDAASVAHTPDALRVAIVAKLRADPRLGKRLASAAAAAAAASSATASAVVVGDTRPVLVELDEAMAIMVNDAELCVTATPPHVLNAVHTTGARVVQPIRRDHGGEYTEVAARVERMVTAMKKAGLNPTVRLPFLRILEFACVSASLTSADPRYSINTAGHCSSEMCIFWALGARALSRSVSQH